MSNIIDHISSERSKLADHAFCQYLRHVDSSKPETFTFVPSMTYFVLGFRDILEEVKVPSPKTKLEFELNEHCEEDANHWLWFIDDLSTLGMDINYWGGNLKSVLTNIWDPQNFCVRDLVYKVIHHIFNSKTAEEKLIIVECLEAAFAAFIENMNCLTQKTGLFNRLSYFGKRHFEQEAGHAMGSWVENDKAENDHDDLGMNMPLERYYHMLFVVEDIFKGFHTVFDRWENVINQELTIAQ